MSFQEAAIAIGLLTPLILGVLAFIEKLIHKKNEPEKGEPTVVQGMPVAMASTFADELIKELRKDAAEAVAVRDRLKIENDLLRVRLGLENDDLRARLGMKDGKE